MQVSQVLRIVQVDEADKLRVVLPAFAAAG
jgi:hypothetical protein